MGEGVAAGGAISTKRKADQIHKHVKGNGFSPFRNRVIIREREQKQTAEFGFKFRLLV